MRIWTGLLVLGALAAAGFAGYVHPFLAINTPVRADVMVVEGWVPDYVLAAAAREFAGGHYRHVFLSGLQNEPGKSRHGETSDADRAARYLAAHGIARPLITPCPAPDTWWNRTSHMARQVRDQMRAAGIHPEGVNVVTLGPHARQTLLAYRRLIDRRIPVGVISIPKNDYNPSRWWASRAGIMKTTKDFAGWAKEWLFGLRS